MTLERLYPRMCNSWKVVQLGVPRTWLTNSFIRKNTFTFFSFFTTLNKFFLHHYDFKSTYIWKNDLKDNISVKKFKHNNPAGIYRNSLNMRTTLQANIPPENLSVFCKHWKLPPAAPITENSPSLYVQVSV